MNDPFTTHGIEHLSASSINEFIQNPARWILKVSGFKDPAGIPAMWRGTAVDNAITKYLFERCDLADAKKHALSIFDEKKKESESFGAAADQKKTDKEYYLLTRYMEAAFDHYKELPTPVSAQTKISITLDEIPVPIIGYIDLQYEDIVRDIKTVGRMPSVVPDTTCRQMSVYAHATGCIPVLDYIHVTSTKSEVLVRDVPNVKKHFQTVKQAAMSMMRVLSVSADIQEVARLYVPDFDDWRWSDVEKEEAIKLWRLYEET